MVKVLMPIRNLFHLLLLLSSTALFAASNNLDLEVVKVRKSNPSHLDFCKRNPGECDMSGPSIIDWSQELQDKLLDISLTVNNEIKFVIDPEEYLEEEYWNYPVSGNGDCEDNALEKRRRLVALGLPRGALRMTTAFHSEMFYAHALLLVETTAGTFVLDQDRDVVQLWYQTPYLFESRERTNGTWERFAQEW